MSDSTAEPAHHVVTEHIRSRAKSARLFAQAGAGGIIVVVGLLILVFALFSISIPGPRGPKIDPLPPFSKSSSASQVSEHERVVSQSEKDAEAAKVQALDAVVQNMRSLTGALWISLAEAAIARIVCALLALYLVQVLSSFVRYHFRLADHLDACADALGSSESAVEFGELVAAFSPRAVEFGDAPRAPTEQILHAVRELIAKLPPKA